MSNKENDLFSNEEKKRNVKTAKRLLTIFVIVSITISFLFFFSEIIKNTITIGKVFVYIFSIGFAATMLLIVRDMDKEDSV